MPRKRTIRVDATFSDEQAIKAYAEHGSYAHAAHQFGVDPSAMRMRLKLLGVPKKPPRQRVSSRTQSKRAKHQRKVRDANRSRRRCLNETKYKEHALPSMNPTTALPFSKCDDCRETHKKGSQ